MRLNAGQLGERPVALLISDVPEVHSGLGARLDSEEFELIHASDMNEGLALARDRSPSAVLLDLDIDAGSGWEVLRALKGDPSTMATPLLAISGSSDTQDKVMAFDLGAMDYLTKPFNIAELRVRTRSAIRLHELVQMLEQRAQIDGLTGLWNRAHFDSRWSESVSHAARHARSLSLAILDADHFKVVNDTYGHPAGDAVLVGIAKTLRHELRACDIACRIGGEEFAVIMPDTDAQGASGVFDRIRGRIEGIIWQRHPEHQVTVSVGVAGTDRASGAMSAAQWVEQADRNLYAAKNTGRNRVVTSCPTGTPLSKAG